MSSVESPLEIRVNLEDARILTFRTENVAEATRILDGINPGKFYESKQFIVGCSDGLTAFQSARVTHVELITSKPPPWPFHHNVRSIRTLSISEYTELLNSKSYVRQPLGDTFFSIAEMELSSGVTLYLQFTINSDPAISPLMPLDHYLYLTQLFSLGGYHVNSQEGGIILINPAHISRLTLHPGPSQPPTGVWHAGKCE